MATFKFVLRKQSARKSGEIPIHMRIYHDYKMNYTSTGIVIHEKFWDEKKQRVRKNHPDYPMYNRHLENMLRDAKEQFFGKQSTEPLTIKKKLQGKSDVDFFIYGSNIVEYMKSKDQYWPAKNLRTALNKLEEFLDKKILPFDQLSPKLLRAFESWCYNTKGNKRNSVMKNMKMFRRVVNYALDDGTISDELNPFKKYKIQEERTEKDRLTLDELEQFKNVDLIVGSKQWHVRNYWMFSFLCAGVRFSDIALLKWKNVENDRLRYRMGKTKIIKDIILTKPAKDILNYYPKGKHDEFVFPILDNNRDYSDDTFLKYQISAKNAYVNKVLKQIQRLAGISTKITFHTSRHTFSDLARQKGVSLYSISKALGHSSLKITEQYLKSFDTDSVDSELQNMFE
jgi:integrase